MQGNTYGRTFSITTFGESHGVAMGVVIDGCPAGIAISRTEIQADLDKRKPGQSKVTTQRKEDDYVEILSGIFEGKTTGTPIALLIRNQDQQSKDYDHIKNVYRPSHADFVYDQKYGFRDYRGGGRSSARETVARVAAGSIAKKLLSNLGVTVTAYVHRVKDVEIPQNVSLDLSQVESNIVRCPHPETAQKMEELILATKKVGDTVGGVIQCLVNGVPAGWGEPVFDKLHADLGKAMLSINAVKGFAYGSGFEGTYLYGSTHNDLFLAHEKGIRTKQNFSGGIQGGISNGQDINFQVAFKPVATIMQDQYTVDSDGNQVVMKAKGRHDPCVLPRAVPIVEAMASLVLADHYLRNRTSKINEQSL